MRNPESMRPTMASRTRIVVEANQIIGRESFKIMDDARLAQDAVLYDRAQDFLNGAEYKSK